MKIEIFTKLSTIHSLNTSRCAEALSTTPSWHTCIDFFYLQTVLIAWVKVHNSNNMGHRSRSFQGKFMRKVWLIPNRLRCFCPPPLTPLQSRCPPLLLWRLVCPLWSRGNSHCSALYTARKPAVMGAPGGCCCKTAKSMSSVLEGGRSGCASCWAALPTLASPCRGPAW